MNRIAGVDGCHGGWICVIAGASVESQKFDTFSDLAEEVEAMIIAVDIPIGLADRGRRQCDDAARRRLGPMRGRSVFPAPIRALLRATTWKDANALSRSLQQKGIPQQSWAICKKIREVDDVLHARPELRERIVEVHPEVSFAEWAGAPLLASKKSREGAALRRALLEQQFPGAFEKIRAAHPRKSDVADDDIADALAALWTAQRVARGMARSLPPEPPLDETGLPMRIVR